VAVFRPARVRLGVLPANPAGNAEVAVARQRLPLHVHVSPLFGDRQDPGEFLITFQTHGAAGAELPLQAPGPGTSAPDGRIYSIAPVFPDPPEGRETYRGRLEVLARRSAGSRVSGSLAGDNAHSVTVYPWFQVLPVPPTADLQTSSGSRTIGKGERGCASFKLEVSAGRLPHTANPTYSVGAILDASLARDARLDGVTFTLDGMPLEIEGKNAESPSWQRGRELSRDALLGQHEICLQTGLWMQSSEAPVTLPLKLFIREAPYHDFDGIRPFQAVVSFGAPPFWDLWGPLTVVLITLLIGLLAFLHARAGNMLPEGLRWRLVSHPDGQGSGWGEIGPAGLLTRLAATGAKRNVTVHNQLIGWIRPRAGDLFEFVPASGYRVATEEGEPTPGLLDVHSLYLLSGPGNVKSWFRLEYDDGPR
jgi:hypothetical protein